MGKQRWEGRSRGGVGRWGKEDSMLRVRWGKEGRVERDE